MSGSDLSKLTPQDCIRLWLELIWGEEFPGEEFAS